MITKKVSRHYCEFCRRGSVKKPTMLKHESGCTANPNRVCGLCAYAGLTPRPTVELIKAFEDSGCSLDDLRKATENCPGCILAVLRQSKMNNDIPEEKIWFDFKKELEEWWQVTNIMRQY